jgi:hypothetical protein
MRDIYSEWIYVLKGGVQCIVRVAGCFRIFRMIFCCPTLTSSHCTCIRLTTVKNGDVYVAQGRTNFLVVVRKVTGVQPGC